jgi:hypothetical protein
VKLSETSSFFDLIIVILNSFELLKKIMESSFSNAVPLIPLYLLSTSVMLDYFYSNSNRIINEEIISITKSILYFSVYYVKSSSFPKGNTYFCLTILRYYCLRFFFMINSWKNSSDKLFNLIKSLFRNSGWTECLINIFKALNPFSLSSSKQSPPFLSFLSSVSPSENTANILECTSEAIILLEDENTPEEVSNYLKLTNF